MPISRKDFDEGLDDRARKIVNFLKSRPEEAFTSREIADGIGMEVGETIEILNFLFHQETFIEREVIAGTYYYAYKKEE